MKPITAAPSSNFLASGAALALPAFGQAPAVVTSERTRPQIASGIQIGDVTGDRAIVWSRADRPARLVVERSFYPDFREPVRVRARLRSTRATSLRASIFALACRPIVKSRARRLECNLLERADAVRAGDRALSPCRFSRRNVHFVWSATPPARDGESTGIGAG